MLQVTIDFSQNLRLQDRQKEDFFNKKKLIDLFLFNKKTYFLDTLKFVFSNEYV